MEERLKQIELSVGGRGAGKASSSLQTDSFAVLLVQGLESKDERILSVSYTSCFKIMKYDHLNVNVKLELCKVWSLKYLVFVYACC